MKYRLIFVFIPFFLFQNAFAQKDECSSLADTQTKSDSSLFVGFGAGSSSKEADNNAQADLAGRIRQQVTAQATVTQSNTTENLTSSTTSAVNEVLTGAKIIKRCQNADSYSSVVTLSRSTFIKSLQEKLLTVISKAQNYSAQLKKENMKPEVSAEVVDNTKQFLDKYEPSFSSDLTLCRTFNGCLEIKKEKDLVLSDLSNLVATFSGKEMYELIVEKEKGNKKDSNMTELVQDEIITLLGDDGIKVNDGNDNVDAVSTNNPRKVHLSCQSKLGTKIPNTSDRVFEISCSVNGFVGKSKKFRKIYSCRVMADDEGDFASNVDACSRLFKLEH